MAAVFWVETAAGRRWAAMESRTRELLAEWKGRDTSRAPLRGAALEGSAWQDYLQADAKIGAYAAALGRPKPGGASLSTHLEEFLKKTPKADQAKVQEIVAALQPALLDFRNGVARRHGRYPIDWSKSWDSPSLVATTRLSNLAFAQARLWVEADRPLDAVQLQLDVLRFGQDIGRDGLPLAQSMGFATVKSALNAVLETLLLGKLSARELESVEHELELLEQSVPRPDGVIQERIHLGTVLEQEPEALADFRPDWRHAFSSRLRATHYAERIDHWGRRLQAQGSWKDVCRCIEEIKQEKDLTLGQLDVFAAMFQEETTAPIARLRLIRTAVHWKRTGEWLQLPDPFGDHLHFQETPTGAKFWSTGRDGVDHLGVGRWNGGNDIVLEMPK